MRICFLALLFLLPVTVRASDDAFAKDLTSIRGETAKAVRELVIPEFDRHRAFIHGPDAVEAVALTFDDGPDRDTPAILEVLKKHHVRATFFMVGRKVQAHPDIAREVAEAGQEIGNHTFSHTNYCERPISVEADRKAVFADELALASQAIVQATGITPGLVRIPYACRSGWVENTARRLGYTVVRWSVDGEDWKRPGADDIAGYYLSHAVPGAVFLLHDGGGDRRQTAEALEKILTGLEKRGLRAVSAGEMLEYTLPPPADAAR
jgi:peptidoglycan/xylan/chitin deacetylase (PgdA/CDA1 family)